jgi:hypothetical protein
VDIFTYGQHRAFVETEGWTRGKSGTSHDNYLFAPVNPDVAVLRTGISHGAASTEYSDPKMRAKIVNEQLQVTEEEFWACVSNRQLPVRRSDGYSVGLRGEEASSPPPQNPGLLQQLHNEFRVAADDVLGMSDKELAAYLLVLRMRRDGIAP